MSEDLFKLASATQMLKTSFPLWLFPPFPTLLLLQQCLCNQTTLQPKSFHQASLASVMSPCIRQATHCQGQQWFQHPPAQFRSPRPLSHSTPNIFNLPVSPRAPQHRSLPSVGLQEYLRSLIPKKPSPARQASPPSRSHFSSFSSSSKLLSSLLFPFLPRTPISWDPLFHPHSRCGGNGTRWATAKLLALSPLPFSKF